MNVNELQTIATDLILQVLRQKEEVRIPEETLENIPQWLEIPPEVAMGDYAFPCFRLAKLMRKAPPKIALEIVHTLQDSIDRCEEFSKVEAVGAYINFHISISFLTHRILPTIFDGSYFEASSRVDKKEKVMIEYSQPNTHKGFHVGHMRNVALGESLCKIYQYNGFEVIAVNYIGDVGTHVAKCLWYYQQQKEPIVTQEKAKGERLGELYTQATLQLDSASAEKKKEYQEEISKILRLLESKTSEVYQLWKTTRQWSIHDFMEIYSWLGVKFDHIFYESDVDELGKELVLEYLEKDIFENSEGAIGIDLKEQKLGFFLLLKSDGNTLYSTKDLALAKKKFEEFKIDRSIYVVGAEQTLHFKQVFATLEKMNYPQATHCFHLPYALVMLPSGKMSSRQGNVILFSELQEKMSQYIQENFLHHYLHQWSDEELEETTRNIAIAAIKYGMLAQDSNKPIVFSLKDWLVSEGNTGTYLLYAYVRIQSIVRQVKEENHPIALDTLTHPNEHVLVRQLFAMNGVVSNAGQQYRPSLIVRYLYDLCKIFSRTYSTCSVKHAQTKELRMARRFLFLCTGKVLKEGLKLLGIVPPERM